MNKPQKVTDLHNQAMEIAEEGYFAQREGDKVAANSKDLRKEVDDFVEFLFKKYAKTA